MANENAEVRQSANFTEAQLTSDGAPNMLAGQMLVASDTERIVYRRSVTAGSPASDYQFVGGGKTGTLGVTDPAEESISGAATTQAEINVETKEQIENLASASMVLRSTTPFSIGDSEANRTRWDFDVSTPSDDTDILDANETSNTITYKTEGRRYRTDAVLKVVNSGFGDAVFFINAYSQADDTPLGDPLEVNVAGGFGGTPVDVPLDPDIIVPTVDDVEFYYGVWSDADSGDLTINQVTAAIQTGAGAVTSSADLQTVIYNGGDVNFEGYADETRVFSYFKDVGGTITRYFSLFGSGVVAIRDALIETLGAVQLTVTGQIFSLGKFYTGGDPGSPTDLGALINIEGDTATGFRFKSEPAPEDANGVYTDEDDGDQNGAPILRYEGAVTWYSFRMLVSGQLYFVVHTSVVDGDAEWNNVTYRLPIAGEGRDGGGDDAYEGLVVNGAANPEGGMTEVSAGDDGLASERFLKLKRTGEEIAANNDPEDIPNVDYLKKYGNAWETIYDGVFDFVPAYTTGTTGLTAFPIAIADPASHDTNYIEMSGRFRITMEYSDGTSSSDVFEVYCAHKGLGGPSAYAYSGVYLNRGGFYSSTDLSLNEFGLVAGSESGEERVGLYLSIPAPSDEIVTNIKIEAANAKNIVLAKDIPDTWGFSTFGADSRFTSSTPLPAVNGYCQGLQTTDSVATQQSSGDRLQSRDSVDSRISQRSNSGNSGSGNFTVSKNISTVLSPVASQYIGTLEVSCTKDFNELTIQRYHLAYFIGVSGNVYLMADTQVGSTTDVAVSLSGNMINIAFTSDSTTTQYAYSITDLTGDSL